MGRGIARPRMQPITDAWIMHVVNAAGGLGQHHPQTGHYGTLPVRCDSAEEAHEYRKSLFRCAYYLHRTGKANVSVFMSPIRQVGGKYVFDFTVTDKSAARGHHIAVNGKDRSKWAYDPMQRRMTPDA